MLIENLFIVRKPFLLSWRCHKSYLVWGSDIVWPEYWNGIGFNDIKCVLDINFGEISVFSTWFWLRKFVRLGARVYKRLWYKRLWMQLQSNNLNKVRLVTLLLFAIFTTLLQVVFWIWFFIEREIIFFLGLIWFNREST